MQIKYDVHVICAHSRGVTRNLSRMYAYNRNNVYEASSMGVYISKVASRLTPTIIPYPGEGQKDLIKLTWLPIGFIFNDDIPLHDRNDICCLSIRLSIISPASLDSVGGGKMVFNYNVLGEEVYFDLETSGFNR